MSADRWQVVATCAGAVDELGPSLTHRAGRTPDVSPVMSYGRDLPEASQFVWLFATKKEADVFAQDMNHIKGCTFESRPIEDSGDVRGKK